MKDSEKQLADVTVKLLKHVLGLQEFLGTLMERYPELIKDEHVRSLIDHLQNPTAEALKQLEQYVERVQTQIDT